MKVIYNMYSDGGLDLGKEWVNLSSEMIIFMSQVYGFQKARRSGG